MVLGLGRAVEAEASYVAGFPVACLLVSYRPLAIIAAATSKNRLELIAVNARVASDASWHHRDGVVA